MSDLKKTTTSDENSVRPPAEVAPSTTFRRQKSEGLTQKKMIEKLIPYFYVLRKKGCSWEQITGLLNDKCGFKILPSTVRSYYGAMFPKQRQICQKFLTEHVTEVTKLWNFDEHPPTGRSPLSSGRRGSEILSRCLHVPSKISDTSAT